LTDGKTFKLRDIAKDARETKTILKEWKKKIVSLEEDLQQQDYAMEEVVKENNTLEEKVAKYARKEKMYITGEQAQKRSMKEVMEENNALEMEVERLKLTNLGQMVGSSESQKMLKERNELRKKQRDLERILAAARRENERLFEEVTSKTVNMGDHSCSEGQVLLERNRLRRKESQLERSLIASKKENKELVKEIQSRNLEFEKTEEEKEKQEEEIRTLRSELEMNRRIVHTKRSIIQKEMSNESKKKMRKEMKEQLTKELTTKITGDLEFRLRSEKDKELKELREADEEKVRNVESQIPVLEKEIDRLRRQLSHSQDDHERAVANIESHYQQKIEFMVDKFSDDRNREGFDFIKRVDALSIENERTKELAAKEKEEYGSQIREEVTREMQKEIEVLADRVAELTKESIEAIETFKEEKELYGNNLREEMTKERDQLLQEAANEKESYVEELTKERDKLLREAANEKELHVEKMRDEMMKERSEETSKLMLKIEKVTSERDSLSDENTELKRKSEEMQQEKEVYMQQMEALKNEKDSSIKRAKEAESDIRVTNEKYAKFSEELDSLQVMRESSKTEVAKLEEEKEELTTMVDMLKSDCSKMEDEVKKIKRHFKFAVLVEYEEKVIELENEIKRLERFIEDSKAFEPKDEYEASDQTSQLEELKFSKEEQDIEMKRLSEKLMSAVSELESKEMRLTALKEIIAKKEAETLRLNQSVKDLRKSLSDKQVKLGKALDAQEISDQRIISIEVYKEKLSSLNKELSEYKSHLEHCRCDGRPFDERQYSESQSGSVQLQERIQRLTVMLNVTEKNHQKEKLAFDATKERLDNSLLATMEEIKGLKSEISRLKTLLTRSQKALRESEERESRLVQLKEETKTPKDAEKKDANESKRTKEEEILLKIEAAEKVIEDVNQYRYESEKTIQELKEKLNSTDEEKRKIAQDLRDSKLLFREAVTSWRVETRSLKNKLEHVKKTKHTESSEHANWNPQIDPHDNLQVREEAESNVRDKLLKIISVDDESKQRETRSKTDDIFSSLPVQISDLDSDSSSWSKDGRPKAKHRSLSSISTDDEQDDSEIRSTTDHEHGYSESQGIIDSHELDKPEVRDDIDQPNHDYTVKQIGEREGEERDLDSKSKGAQSDNIGSSRGDFTKMTDISEHSTSIEMTVSRHGEENYGDKRSSILHTLQEFKDEYQEYIDTNDSPKPKKTNSSNVLMESKSTNFSRPPQPHIDSLDGEDNRNLRESTIPTPKTGNTTSLAMTLPTPKIRNTFSGVDSRDGSIQDIHGRVSFMREKSLLDFSTSHRQKASGNGKEDRSSSSTSVSSQRSSSASERSRLLRKKMSDLLEIKNSIKERTSTTSLTATKRSGEIVANIRDRADSISTASTVSTVPWGLAADRNPKLYKHLKSKSSSSMTAPMDEQIDRRDALPFDEKSKYSLRE